jgi:hypothetical protein
MRPAETIIGIRGGGIKENDGGVNSTVIYLIYCKNVCKYYSVPPPSTTIKKKKVQTIGRVWKPKSEDAINTNQFN